jgi:hypothetical protein
MADAIDRLPDCFVVRTQVLPDPAEADLWHGLIQLEFKALAPVA